MLRLRSIAHRNIAACALALALAACGTKGALVPAKKSPDAETPPLPPAATTTPDIPSATLPSNSPPPP
jgi:hypothetical protein